MTSPWKSIWLEPSKTMRQLLDSDPKKELFLLSILWGVVNALDKASSKSLGDKMPLESVLILCFVVGPFMGMIALYIDAWLFTHAGRWLGGTGKIESLQAAVAWGKVPYIATLPISLGLTGLLGKEMFTEETPLLASNDTLCFVALAALVFVVIGWIWSFVVECKTIGVAHGFSAWKGLATYLVGYGIIIVPLACLLIAFKT